MTGAAKLDGDVLFDSADVELKEDAQEMLAEFAQILRMPEARDLKRSFFGLVADGPAQQWNEYGTMKFSGSFANGLLVKEEGH